MTCNGTTGGASTVGVATLFRNYYGWNSSFVIQNLGTQPISPFICYSANANPEGPAWEIDYFILTEVIEPGENLMFSQGDGDRYVCEGTGGEWDEEEKTCDEFGETIPEGYLGGATVTIFSGDGPMAGVANTTHDDNQAAPGLGDWSGSFNTTDQ